MLTTLEFDYLRRLVYEYSAIVLEPEKEYLAISRLTPIARREGFRDLKELVLRLQKGARGSLHERVVEAFTTNETSFFRDSPLFEALRETVIPELVTSRASER